MKKIFEFLSGIITNMPSFWNHTGFHGSLLFLVRVHWSAFTSPLRKYTIVLDQFTFVVRIGWDMLCFVLALHDLLEVQIEEAAAAIWGYLPKDMHGSLSHPFLMESLQPALGIAICYFAGGSLYDIMIKFWSITHLSFWECWDNCWSSESVASNENRISI